MGGGGNYYALIGAGIKAAGDRMGGWGPKPDEFITHRTKWTSKRPFKDLKALHEGGIDDPRLDYLGPSDETRARLRDWTEGPQIAAEQNLGDKMRGYGGPSANSGVYMQGLARLRADRTRAMAGALRDLEVDRWRNFQGMQQMYGQAHEQFQNDDQVAYQRAMTYWKTKKDHYAMAGQALGDAVTEYGRGATGSQAPSAPQEQQQQQQAPSYTYGTQTTSRYGGGVNGMNGNRAAGDITYYRY